MSLINDALKKTQQLRHEQQMRDAMPLVPGGTATGRIAKRHQAMPAQTIVLIGAVAAVLIVLSAVLTGYFLNRTPEPKSASATTVVKIPTPVQTPAASPVIIAPVVEMPKPEPPPEVKSGPVPPTLPAATKPSAPPPLAVAAVIPAESQAGPAEVKLQVIQIAPPPKTAAPAAARDPRVQSFVDRVRVAGIRYSGNESRVLMNDRVYRVNDVVDFNLSIRLQKVEPDSLLFVDANGVVYVKNF